MKKPAPLTLHVDPRIRAILCEGAARSGVDLETWLASAAGEALPDDLQDEWRKVWGAILMEDYHAEFGEFTPEELEAAERIWQTSH